MKITPTAGSNPIRTEIAAKKPGTKMADEAKAAAKNEDADFIVQLSSKISQMAAAPSTPDEARQAKVAAIRDQLASGNYNISGKDVAAKMLNLLKG